MYPGNRLESDYPGKHTRPSVATSMSIPSTTTSHLLPPRPSPPLASSVTSRQQLGSAIPECILQHSVPEWVQTGQLPSVSASLAQSQPLLMPQDRASTCCFYSAGPLGAVPHPLRQDRSHADAVLADPSTQASWCLLILASHRAVEDFQASSHTQAHVQDRPDGRLDKNQDPCSATVPAAPFIVSGTHRRRPAPSSSSAFHPHPYHLATPPPQDYAGPGVPATAPPPPYRRNRSMSHTAMHVNLSRPSSFAFAPFGSRSCIDVDCVEESQEDCSHNYSGGPYQQPRMSARCGRPVPRMFSAQMPPKTKVN